MQSEYFMREALAEGRKARGHCAPNPPVGCVIVLDKRIVGRGHTQPPGNSHAEVFALNSAGDIDHSESIVYVTLEPCSFQGRTPSCAKALADIGVSKVVIALVDPDPRNSGAGVAILRQSGIDVDIGFLSGEAFRDLGPHLTRANHALQLTAQSAAALRAPSAAFGCSGGN